MKKEKHIPQSTVTKCAASELNGKHHILQMKSHQAMCCKMLKCIAPVPTDLLHLSFPLEDLLLAFGAPPHFHNLLSAQGFEAALKKIIGIK